MELKLAHKTVCFAYYPARDSPISVAEQMHREVDDEEIGALSMQHLSDLIAAAIPSSVELGILPPLARTPTATAATAWWGEEGGNAPLASWRQRMHIGFRVDAMDTQRAWYEALVCDVRGANVCVHYRAWASRWDRWLPRDSREIALPWTRVPSFRNFRQGDRVELKKANNLWYRGEVMRAPGHETGQVRFIFFTVPFHANPVHTI